MSNHSTSTTAAECVRFLPRSGTNSTLFVALRLGALLSLSALWPGIAWGQTCNLDGDTIEFVGVRCTDLGCSNMHQKLLVLGGKVLRYTDLEKSVSDGNQGVVYYLGKTVDRNDDRLNPPLPGVTPDDYSALSAEYSGTDLILDEKYGQKSNPVDYVEDRTAVRFPKCGTCELISYRVGGVHHGQYYDMEWKGGLCTVTH